jgi:hypothetical protein
VGTTSHALPPGAIIRRAFVHEETAVRGLLENLSPENHQISWSWIGGVFAFYVVIMAAAMGMLVAQESDPGAWIATAVATPPRAVIAMPAL